MLGTLIKKYWIFLVYEADICRKTVIDFVLILMASIKDNKLISILLIKVN